MFGFGLLLSLLFVWICFWQLFLGLRSVFFCPLSNTSNELSDFSFVYASCRTVDKTFVSGLLWIGFGVMVSSDFRYRLLLCELVRNSACLKKGKRLSEQSERINRCDSTATRKPSSIRLASHRHQQGVCHPHLIAVLSLPAVGTFRRRRRGAGRLLPTPRHQRRNPHLHSVRTLPKVGSTALRCSRSAPFERSPKVAFTARRSPSAQAHGEASPRNPASPMSSVSEYMRNTCKLYVAHGNMVIDHITMSYELALCWTALPDSPTKVPHRGFRARCRNRMRDSHGPSGLCMLQTLGVLPGAARAL